MWRKTGLQSPGASKPAKIMVNYFYTPSARRIVCRLARVLPSLTRPLIILIVAPAAADSNCLIAM